MHCFYQCLSPPEVYFDLLKSARTLSSTTSAAKTQGAQGAAAAQGAAKAECREESEEGQTKRKKEMKKKREKNVCVCVLPCFYLMMLNDIWRWHLMVILRWYMMVFDDIWSFYDWSDCILMVHDHSMKKRISRGISKANQTLWIVNHEPQSGLLWCQSMWGLTPFGWNESGLVRERTCSTFYLQRSRDFQYDRFNLMFQVGSGSWEMNASLAFSCKVQMQLHKWSKSGSGARIT